MNYFLFFFAENGCVLDKKICLDFHDNILEAQIYANNLFKGELFSNGISFLKEKTRSKFGFVVISESELLAWG